MELKNVLDNLIESEKKVTLEEHEDTIEKLKNTNFNASDVEEFSIYVSTSVEMIEEIVLESKLTKEDLESPSNEKIKFMYIHYDFVNNQVMDLLARRHGGNVHDVIEKANYIIKSYVEYLRIGHIRALTADEANLLPSFGDRTEWFTLCDAIIQLYDGDFENMLAATHPLLTQAMVLNGELREVSMNE